MKELNKLKPVSQGTQAIQSEVKPTETTADEEHEDIVEIPDDEADIVVRNLLKSSGVKIPEVKKTQGKCCSSTFNTKKQKSTKTFHYSEEYSKCIRISNH